MIPAGRIRRRLRWLLVAAVLLLLAYLIVLAFEWPRRQDVTLENGARLDWVPCWFHTAPLSGIECARLHTAPEPPTGRSDFVLPVVILRHRPWRVDESPILYLSGGPGGATALDEAGIADWREWYRQTGWEDDLVLFDQRGAGESQPRLDCPEIRDWARGDLGRADPPRNRAEAYRDLLRACVSRLRAAGAPVDRISTARSAADAADLMRAIGSNRWNIYGVSYGTRLALAMLARNPQALRAVVLDSIYPPEVDALLTQPAVMDGMLRSIVEGCESDGACARAWPRLGTQLEELLERLAAQPVTIGIDSDGEPGGPLEVALNDERLLDVLFDAMYDWTRIGELPRALAALAAGDASRMKRLVEDHVAALLDESFSEAVYYAVECRDRPPVSRDAYEQELQRYPPVRRYAEWSWELDPCADWRNGDEVSPPSRVRSDVPALLLAGEYDPVTPVDWSRSALEGLPNAHLVVFPGIGHGVLDSDECAILVTREFLEDPVQVPEPACLGELSGPSFDAPAALAPAR